MSQRMALVLAGGITAFILVLLGAVIFTIRLADTVQVRAASQAAPISAPAQPSTSSPRAATLLNGDQAAQIALNIAPGARLAGTPDLVDFQGTVAFEVPLDQGLVYVDANSGRVLSTTLSATTGPARRGGLNFERGRELEEEGDD